MKRKKINLQKEQKPNSFSDLLWFKGYVPREIEYIAEQNNLTCMCMLPNTPIEAAIWFHTKIRFYA